MEDDSKRVDGNYLQVIQKELEIREKELEYKHLIQMKGIESSDKQNDRELTIFQASQEERKKEQKFKHTVSYIMLLMLILSLGASFYFISKDNPIGRDMLILIIGIVSGGLGGWGYAKSREKEEEL